MTTYKTASLFNDDSKTCKDCHRILPQKYEEELCPACKERELFSRVKEYIRKNDVTEFDVAEHFEIPHAKVKGWIRDGRIEYKDLHNSTIISLYCRRCGEPISFGTLCLECQRKSKISGNATNTTPSSDERFRYL